MKLTNQQIEEALLRGYRLYLAERGDQFDSTAMVQRQLEELQRAERDAQ